MIHFKPFLLRLLRIGSFLVEAFPFICMAALALLIIGGFVAASWVVLSKLW